MAPSPSAPRADVYAVVLAGGSGTRFWPLSRKKNPKQFLALTSSRSLLEETLRRIDGVIAPSHRFVVCGKLHAAPVKKRAKGLKANQVLVEPEAKNTAPAIALATAHVAARDPNGIVVILPSDQHVANVPAFHAALERAVTAARAGSIVTLGIHPTRPETGYGYIRSGETLPDGAKRVAAFVEKPDRATAESYMLSGEYLWNAGIFIFRADVMMEALRAHLPLVAQGTERITKVVGTKKYATVLKKEFAQWPSISIDYGVAEKARQVAVVPGDFGWSDVGSFNALPEVRPPDADGNVVVGQGAVVIDSKGCVVWAGERPLAVVGMTDVVIVDSGDAVLVLPKHKSQDVRKVVEALKASKRERYI
jgi:mannose-1-phosphate guanylyltransferase